MPSHDSAQAQRELHQQLTGRSGCTNLRNIKDGFESEQKERKLGTYSDSFAYLLDDNNCECYGGGYVNTIPTTTVCEPATEVAVDRYSYNLLVEENKQLKEALISLALKL